MFLILHKKALLPVIMYLMVTPVFGQYDHYPATFNRKKDSLINELKKHPLPDTGRAMALVNIIDVAVFLKQREQVLPYWKEAIELSHKLKFTKAEAVCLLWRGGYYKSAKKNDSAYIFLDSAISLIGNSPDSVLRMIKGLALFQKALIHENKENYYTALDNYFESLKSYRTNEDLQKQKNLFLRIAFIYQQLNNDEKALEYYQHALKIYQQMHGSNATNIAEGINTIIAGIYFKQGEFSKTRFYLDKINPEIPDTLEPIVTGDYYRLNGQLAYKEGKKDTALNYLKEALTYYNDMRQMHMDEIVTICTDIAGIKLEAGEMAEAKKYAEQALATAQESGHKATLARALKCMATYYSKTNNLPAAYAALERAIILNDSVLAEANIKQANTLAAIYENDKKEKSITKLEADKTIQAATVIQKSLWNTIFIITIAALLLSGFLVYRNFKNKQKLEQQKIAELEKEKKLMAVESMLKGQEAERIRLAKDLHDGLGGMLSGVKISFSNMKENMIMDAANTAVFEKSLLQLDSSIAELRKVAHNLMPEALAKFGLKSAVKDYCDYMQLPGNTKVICEQFGPERDLGNAADVNVYRIIQELVNNAVTHGAASQIVVQLTKTANKVLITVEDNGKGFDLSAPEKSPGIGLSNIKSRVNYFNGNLDIDSKPGEGTTVNIEITA